MVLNVSYQARLDAVDNSAVDRPTRRLADAEGFPVGDHLPHLRPCKKVGYDPSAVIANSIEESKLIFARFGQRFEAAELRR